MHSEYMIREERRRVDGKFKNVWGVYRLKRADLPDEPDNREYATEFSSKAAAAAMARELNENLGRCGI